MPSPDAPRDADRERLAQLLYKATVSVQPNPPSWEYRALYSPDGHDPYYRMADAVLAERAEESHPLYSVTQEGLITIVQCGSCADLRAQLATATAERDTARGRVGELEEHARQLVDASEIRAEQDRLRAEVREWLCVACNTVYPGPPSPGFDCVVCPKCQGDCGPRLFMENRLLEAKAKRAEQAEHESHVLATEWQSRRDEMIAAHERALRDAQARNGLLRRDLEEA